MEAVRVLPTAQYQRMTPKTADSTASFMVSLRDVAVKHPEKRLLNLDRLIRSNNG